MVFPIPNEKDKPDAVSANKQAANKRKKKKKSKARKTKREEIFKKKHRFVTNMSSWAEQFTVAATWQMKHELAFWKAKAVSLEYENKILHDIIRKNCNSAPGSSRSESVSDFRNGPVPKMYANRSDNNNSESESEQEEQENECYEDEEEEGNWEVSEEFIEFLAKNAKFKEDARRERERLKAEKAEKTEIEILESGPSQPTVNRSAEMEELYGENWKKVAALEMSVQSHFMNESDKCKPSYWPNIPLNFG
ncbi:gemini of cajal bodies-associated protein 8 domain-containing protein [Phthorimaea operculella]|nr:gemini of cajal bodies-associated protein 8 domain-containing protein [Phthorimaea operculella]